MLNALIIVRWKAAGHPLYGVFERPRWGGVWRTSFSLSACLVHGPQPVCDRLCLLFGDRAALEIAPNVGDVGLAGGGPLERRVGAHGDLTAGGDAYVVVVFSRAQQPDGEGRELGVV